MIIKSQRKKNALLTALADEEMVKIMNCVMYHSKSFNDITAENNDIPRTTAFRKIKWLLNQEILIVENNEVIVETEQNINIAKRGVAKFFSLD